MEKRIELEKRARKPNTITELNLDNCRSTNIVGLTDEYTALETLSLINVGLTTLKGFPKLPNLKKLELSDNRISGGLNHLASSPKIQYLNLSGNKIKDLETLKPLEEFKNLAVLDLFNNEATHVENYRERIFEMLPSLKFLDGFDCNDVEAPSDGDDDDELNGNESEGGNDVSDDDDDEEGGEEEEEEEFEYDEEDDVNLSEVYNEDLEEDNSEWDEDSAVEENDEDDDISDDEADANESATGKSGSKDDQKTVEDSQSRGKKRKHDG